MIRVLVLLILLTGCSQKQVATHMGTGVGAVTGFYQNDINTHTAVFVDTLNTAPGKRSHTNWGNSANGNWGSITINRTYINNNFKCRDYESVISIEHSWPMSGISRESETGIACQLPDGRWKITESTNS